MKKLLIFLSLIWISIEIASASVVVHNYSIDNEYSPFEIISGKINLTIINENYDTKIISNDNDEINIGEFLKKSGNIFKCFPPDCSRNYNYLNGYIDNIFDIKESKNKNLGFILNGENVVLDSLDFKIKSNFEESQKQPLIIKFFEREIWKFNSFSNSFTSKNWGCYNSLIVNEGPLIGPSLYCEIISIPDSEILKVGAIVQLSDNKELNMDVYQETGIGSSWKCNYNPNSEDGCIIKENNEIFSAGNYQICVSSDTLTNYKIYEESGEDSCGFPYDLGIGGSSKDYSIFAQTVKYADSDSLNLSNFNYKDIVDAANELIEERYSGNCSSGCILPIEISGISQNVWIYNISLKYTANYEWESTDKIYDLNFAPILVDTNGVFDLDALNFTPSKTMNYNVSIGEVKLFEEMIKILPAPIILSVIPLNPPAGTQITFYVGINFTGNKSLNYEWDFGDGKIVKTQVPFVSHTYMDLENYTLSLEVSAGGNLTSRKIFNIKTISPENAIDVGLILKKNFINGIALIIESFPSWYSDTLSELIGITYLEGELNSLDRARNNSFNKEDFIDVAKRLYDLNVPVEININAFDGLYLPTDLNDINIEPIEIISGSVSGSNNDDYSNPIFNWQNENIDASFSGREFAIMLWNGESKEILRTYSFKIKSKSYDESYFVINRPFSELYFKNDVGARKAGKSTVIILPAESSTSFEFYYKDSEPTTFFVSPKLGSMVIEAKIDTSCNYNLVCEKEKYGENYKNCRSDCKPTKKATIYIILLLVLILIIYSIFQIWYKRHYEKYLFKDDRQMYNLLMYVTNARARGIKDPRISAELRAKGWSSERVNYIMKKSRGKRTGLYEIIPFEKISAYFRNRKAKKRLGKVVNRTSNIATNNQQQIRRNINKSRFRRRV